MSTATSVVTAANGSQKSKPPIWEWDGLELDAWMMNTLREASLKAKAAVSKGKVLPAGAAAPAVEPPTSETLQMWYRRVLEAVQAVKLIEDKPPVDDEEEEDENEEGRRAKRQRRRPKYKLQDPYHVWWISKYNQKPTDEEPEEEEDSLPTSMGGRFAQLSAGGWLNALAGILNGVVHKSNPPMSIIKAAAVTYGPSIAVPTNQPPAEYVLELWETSLAVHVLVQAAVSRDIWRTTPDRIQKRLASDISAAEFASIRKRVYETVILGKGLHVNDEDEAADTPVAPMSAVHDIEKYKKCPNCNNMDQSSFALDRKNGDIICSNCGVVVTESLMHEGSAYRKFEGEADRNHHGDAPNALYSNAHNLSTSLSGVAPTAGAGIGGWGAGQRGGNLETILRNTHAYTELNVSQYGKTERRTRVGYKDRQKKEAFVQMTHTGDALNLHEAVVQRAKELFAGFRDDRELVQQFKGVLAACLCEAFEQLASEGKDGFLVKGVGATTHQDEELPDEPEQLSGRAARRKELHHANMAGKGGLNLDLTSVEVGTEDDVTKPAATWDLEDCRSWLLEASRRIAQQWVKDRQAAPVALRSKWPVGKLEELEGQLVEHSIVLCEHLEQELNARVGAHARRVITPRVQDMTKLRINWQTKRAAGVKARAPTNDQTAKQGNRTAGQILLLKTAQKLSSILNDPLAGESIHKELRAVIGKQEEQKRKQLLEEASRQRFQQMQRKPWLQARAQIET